ncbi:MAG: hypothetical protein M3237_08425 [Actinomycetota bacterium]|nr:hypothetical protein [Actinomycetota bacterium]
MLSSPLTRRTALAVTAAMTGLASGACTSDSPTGPSGPTSTSAQPVDADHELATSVAIDILLVRVFVDSLARDFPALLPELRPLRRLHSAHVEAVGGVDDGIPAPAPFAGGRAEALGALVRSEQHLQRELASAAVRAESGTLAKLLASMSAAVAQHLAVLR